MGSVLRNCVGLMLVGSLVSAAGCGGGSDDGDAGSALQPVDVTAGDVVDEVAPVAPDALPPSLLAFGDLVDMRGAPSVATFDAAAGSLELDDTALVTVPAGAFAGPTEVTATVADLAFDRFVERGPTGTAYVLSTSGDVPLDRPITLSINAAPDDVSIAHHVDDVWQPIDPTPSPDGTGVEVPITHFSDNATIVLRPPSGDRGMVSIGEQPDGDAPSEFLGVCLITLKGLFLKMSDEAVEVGGLSGFEKTFDGDWEDILAYSFCTKALVRKYSPEGSSVDLGCVDDQMAGGMVFQSAIDNCIGDPAPAGSAAGDDGATTTITVASGDSPDAGAPDQRPVTDGRYVGSMDDAGWIFDVEVGDNRLDVVVDGGAVTDLSLRWSGRYSACTGGYGTEGEVSCTVWSTSEYAMSGGPVTVSEGSTDVSVTGTQTYSDCESDLASECKDWDYTDVEAGVFRVSIVDDTMTGSFLFEGTVVEGMTFTATRS